MLQAAEFRRRFFNLILLTWTIPPVFGLLFIIFIRILSPEQLIGILFTPLEPLYILGWLAFALWYFPRYVRPISAWLDDPDKVDVTTVLENMRRFPLHYWGIFLVYLLLAPASVIISAEIYTDYIAQPVDWFRIHLVALIVSIIVGLPIFFLILDLFGRALRDIEFVSAHITVKTKVFLIGALVPLLIDTMIVQYYWTRTGFFSFETFVVWLFLELLAIGGSLIFVRSFGQSLAPLQSVINSHAVIGEAGPPDLAPRSTDELGVLATGYHKLLQELRVRNDILALNNRLLRSVEESDNLASLIDSVIKLARDAVKGEMAFLLLKDENEEQLIGVAQTDAGYDPAGHYRLSLDEASIAVWVYQHGNTVAMNDSASDSRVSPRMREMFNVHACVASPLIVDGKAIGVLMLISQDAKHRYSSRDVALLEGLAREAALAINTARLKEQRHQAEEAEAERETQVRLLLDSTAEAIYGVDLEGICTFVNPACVQMLGYTNEEELLGQNMHDLIHHTLPDGTPYAKEDCLVRHATLTGKSSHVESEVHWRADGSSFPVEYWSHPIRRNDEIIGTVVTFFDISERKQAEAKLQDTQKMLQLVLDTIPVRVFWKDHDSVYLGCNKLFAEDSGLQEPDKLIGKTDFDMGWQEQAELYRADDRDVMQTGIRKLNYEEPQTTPDGEQIWLETSKIPLTDQDGGVIGILGTYHDITDRKRAEEELANYQEHLEELVAMRTAELEAVNKELESFSYSVSHDLRSPLRAIDGFSQTLLEEYADKLDPDGQQYLDRVRNAAQRMGVLIDDMLKLSRVTRSEIKREMVDLSALGLQVIEELQKNEPQRQVEVTVMPGMTVIGDRSLLEIVLENLLGNAWKYTGGMDMARIEFGSEILENETVYFVQDNGIGFDMQYANKLFTPFQRLHSSGEFPGTGIGLATVARIIARHNGRIWAEATPDQGACFRFVLG
jgi:PAS domain S-box-containing protein